MPDGHQLAFNQQHIHARLMQGEVIDPRPWGHYDFPPKNLLLRQLPTGYLDHLLTTLSLHLHMLLYLSCEKDDLMK